jgi:hypothetical protein
MDPDFAIRGETEMEQPEKAQDDEALSNER